MATKSKEFKVKSPISIENAQIIFRNFSGKGGTFNPEGRRQFCVKLDEDLANTLSADGWNVKWLEPRDPQDDRQAYLPVGVNYGHVDPMIIMITESGKTPLDEASLSILDWAEIESADLIINPYNWEVGGKTGVKAYLKTLYIKIIEDEFARKYKNVPDTAANCIGDHCNVPPWEED